MPDPDRPLSVTTRVRKIGNPLRLGRLCGFGGPNTGNSVRNGNYDGPYKIVSREGVKYRVVSTRGKTLIAHHNLLKSCPMPTDKGAPFHPTNKTPGITIVRRDEEGLGEGEPLGGRARTARPPFLQ